MCIFSPCLPQLVNLNITDPRLWLAGHLNVCREGKCPDGAPHPQTLGRYLPSAFIEIHHYDNKAEFLYLY
jgi:hypothetical protein